MSRSTTVRWSAPSSSSAWPTAAPAPPAPISTTSVVAASGKPFGEPGGEAGGVGVVADRPRVVEDDGVDRAERSGGVVDGVEVRDHQSLAGVGDVQRVEAECAGPGEDLADPLGRDAHLVEVDGAVHVVETVGPALGHVQRGGERRPHAGADEADEDRVRIVTTAPLS